MTHLPGSDDLLPDAPASLRAQLIGSARSLRARRGQVVLASGLGSSDVFLILSGSLRVSLFSSAGREVTFRDLAGGEMFGELAGIDGEPRSATIMATADSLLGVVRARDFREAVTASPEAAMWLAARLARQIRSLTERVFELSALNVRSRVHCELLRMCALAGIEDNRAELLRPPTHDALASRIGTHREAVTREIGYLASTGIVSRRGHALAINDVARLAGIVGSATGEAVYPPSMRQMLPGGRG